MKLKSLAVAAASDASWSIQQLQLLVFLRLLAMKVLSGLWVDYCRCISLRNAYAALQFICGYLWWILLQTADLKTSSTAFESSRHKANQLLSEADLDNFRAQILRVVSNDGELKKWISILTSVPAQLETYMIYDPSDCFRIRIRFFFATGSRIFCGEGPSNSLRTERTLMSAHSEATIFARLPLRFLRYTFDYSQDLYAYLHERRENQCFPASNISDMGI